MAITVEKFLECVQKNASRVTHYESGGDGSGGGCDCIGLIIGALRLAGEQWKGTHGTNWAARNAIQEPWPYKLTQEKELWPGMIVFKMREKNDPGYSLPDSYKDSGDSRDFYHVGVVMAVKPLTIMHCTKALSMGIDGITEDHSTGNWGFYAKLKGVVYPGQENKEDILYYAKVHSANGKPVRLRPQPSTEKDEICKLPINTVVAVLDDSLSGWDKVEYTGIVGYMMTEFLAPIWDTETEPDAPEEPEQTEQPGNEDTGEDTTVSRGELADWRKSLYAVIDKINKRLEG